MSASGASGWAHAAAVFMGSGLGGVSRYGVSLAGKHLLNTRLPTPWPALAGTWFVNLAGSLLLGWLVSRQFAHPSSEAGFLGSQVARLALTTGFMGGFTTYSTFNTEVVSLMQSGRSREALMYLLATAGCCLLGGWIGMSVGSS